MSMLSFRSSKALISSASPLKSKENVAGRQSCPEMAQDKEQTNVSKLLQVDSMRKSHAYTRTHALHTLQSQTAVTNNHEDLAAKFQPCSLQNHAPRSSIDTTVSCKALYRMAVRGALCTVKECVGSLEPLRTSKT